MLETILDFFTEMLILDWLQGQRVLDLFDDYIFSQPDHYVVLMIYGVSILALIGLTWLVRAILKVTMVWLKFALVLALIYYVFVIVLGIELPNIFGS